MARDIIARGMAASAASGGGGGSSKDSHVIVLHDTGGVLDKTWQEIYDAILDGKILLLPDEDDSINIALHREVAWARYNPAATNPYIIGMFTPYGLTSPPALTEYSTNSADDYPISD